VVELADVVEVVVLPGTVVVVEVVVLPGTVVLVVLVVLVVVEVVVVVLVVVVVDVVVVGVVGDQQVWDRLNCGCGLPTTSSRRPIVDVPASNVSSVAV
jgi:hypothetical protein